MMRKQIGKSIEVNENRPKGETPASIDFETEYKNNSNYFMYLK